MVILHTPHSTNTFEIIMFYNFKIVYLSRNRVYSYTAYICYFFASLVILTRYTVIEEVQH
jgi:hypothetical protein